MLGAPTYCRRVRKGAGGPLLAALLAASLWTAIATPPEIHPALISGSPSDDFVALAVNELRYVSPGAVTLDHPSYDASFTADAMTIALRRGPEWAWSFTEVTVGARRLQANAAPPLLDGLAVRYDRGPLIEEWVARDTAIEQRFVIPEPLPAGDVVVAGAIDAQGAFAARATGGWEWRDGAGAVVLGDVTVFDALGRELPATMTVTASSTRITVAASGLAAAVYPVVVDPQVGPDDFRISFAGPDGGTNFTTLDSAAAYNPKDDHYLVVWQLTNAAGDQQIYGQLVDGTTGARIGPHRKLSDMAGFAGQPDVAYSPHTNEFLVVWHGWDDVPPLKPLEREVFGQFVRGTLGTQVGPNDFRISDMGPNGNTSYFADSPRIAYGTRQQRFLVVWHGEDTVDSEFEIYGQLIDAAGRSEAGSGDLRLSDMGPEGATNFSAVFPDVAYNPGQDQFLVVWRGIDNTGGLVSGESEVFGQRLRAIDLAPRGANDFRISDAGGTGNTQFEVVATRVAYATGSRHYLVTWIGDDDRGALIDNDREVFGQLLTATGAPAGPNDFRISDMGPNGSTDYDVLGNAVAYNDAADEFLVVWSGEDERGPLTLGEFEIFGERIDAATGARIGHNDFRLSTMGPNGPNAYAAITPDVAAGSSYLVTWQGSDTDPGLNDQEIFGQLWDNGPPQVAAPIANRTATAGGPATSIPLAPVFSDPDADPLRYRAVSSAPGIVAATVSGSTLELTYPGSKPGPARVTVTARDRESQAASDTFRVTVTAPADTVGLVDPSQGRWHLRNGAGQVTSFFFGNPGDVPIMGDWDCNGTSTPGMYRQSDGFVYLSNANKSQIADIRFFFGNPGDVPLAGDFNGDGCDTVSIYRPAEGRFFIINKLGQNEGGLGAAETAYLFGNPGDKPFVGDFDGDGIETVGLHRESTGLVYFRQTHTQGVADAQFIFGDPGDRLVAGDWTANGTDSPALFRPSNRTFFFRFTNTQGIADAQFVFGQPSWLPVAGTFGLG